MNLTELRDLLRELTEKFPPGPGQAHGVVMNPEGTGLMVSVVHKGKFHAFNLEEVDYDKDYEALRKELLDALGVVMRFQEVPVGMS